MGTCWARTALQTPRLHVAPCIHTSSPPQYGRLRSSAFPKTARLFFVKWTAVIPVT